MSATLHPPGLTAPLSDLPVLLALTATMLVTFLVIGQIADLQRLLHRRSVGRVGHDLVTVLSADDEAAGAAAERLVGVSPRILLPIVQRLAADLDGDADERLRMLVAVTGMSATIGRRIRSRRWRRRAQAAALCPLLPDGDPRRISLLRDPNAVVRARAAENLERADIVDALPHLLRLLDDPSDAVRFSAQHALLQGDGRIVPTIAEYLRRAEGPGVVWALEVAANLRDPRLAAVVERHARSDDPALRAMAARSLAPSTDGGNDLLADLLADLDADVRAMACAAASSTTGGEILAASIGRLLADRSWTVRQSAGRALGAMGATGAMVLRAHLTDTDPYARDMARRALDDVAARGGRSVMPAPIPADLDTWPGGIGRVA